MREIKSMSKSEFANRCGVSRNRAAVWFNSDFFSELSKLGYKKTQKVFTPRQTSFLIANIIEFDDKE